MRFSDIVNPTVRFGVVLIRCDSVRFSKIVNAAVGAFMYPTARFGAGFRNKESYGAVRCGFQICAVINRAVSYGFQGFFSGH